MNQRTLFVRLKNTRGTVSVVVALTLLALIGFGSLAIDVGYMMVNRNEIQNVADAAALASTRTLGAIYEPMSVSDQDSYVVNRSALVTAAQEAASNNFVKNDAGNTIVIDDADVVIGRWNPVTRTLVPTTLKPDAVRVTARKDSTVNGPVATFLAGVVGVGSFNVSATATAALTSTYKVPEGGLPLPVGISKAWFSDPKVYCVNPIKFYPTGTAEGCAGWHVYNESPSSADELKTILGGLNTGTYASPETVAGVTQFDFTGGNIANALCTPDNNGNAKGQNNKADIATLFNTMKVKNDGVLDKDDKDDTWTTTVPVYNSSDCNNPNGDMIIVGFTTVEITKVSCPPDEQVIEAKVVCDTVENGSGGGEDFGQVGSIPNLVQ